MQASQIPTRTADAECCTLKPLCIDAQTGQDTEGRCSVVPNLSGRARHLYPYPYLSVIVADGSR